MSKKSYEDRLENWKNKAKSRRIQLSYQHQRIKELRTSRDYWKSKYQAEKAKSSKSSALLNTGLNTEKARGHQYSLVLVWWLVELQSYGQMSLRACRHSFQSLVLVLALETRVPSHTTIRNWVCKCGYYRVHYWKKGRDLEPNLEPNSWVYWVDESMQFGGEKILLILGLSLAKNTFGKALQLSDIQVLHVSVSSYWKGEDIVQILEECAVYFPPAYIVSDQGNNLKKAFRLGGYCHIPDCTHWIADQMKKCYALKNAEDAHFKAFCKLTAHLRKRHLMRKSWRGYLPPKQRTKARFANIFPLVKWAQKCLQDWDSLPKEVQEECIWILENQSFIKELERLRQYYLSLTKTLKTQGFSTEIAQELRLKFKPQTAKERQFYQGIQTYFQVLEQRKEQHQIRFKIWCCSDIIESAFGKFKHKINPNQAQKMTEFILTLANFGSQFSKEEVRQALQKVKLKDLQNHKELNFNF